MRTSDVASVVLASIALVLLLAILGMWWFPMQTTPSRYGSGSVIQTVEGIIADPYNAAPNMAIYALVNGTLTTVRASGIISGVLLPKAKSALNPPSIELVLKSIPTSSVCNTFKGSSAFAATDALISVSSSRASYADVQEPVVGLGRTSSFVKFAAGRWMASKRLETVALYASIPILPCLEWRWTPMLAVDVYAIELQPTVQFPWKYAVLDVGRWTSILPGAADEFSTIALRTSSGCGITVVPSTYTSQVVADNALLSSFNAPACVLGISTLGYLSACAFDVNANTFGLLTISVGNVFQNSQTYSFA